MTPRFVRRTILLAACLTQGCSGGNSPKAADPHPQVAFRADTLVVLSQEVSDASGARMLVRKFALNTAGCEWIAEATSPEPETED